MHPSVLNSSSSESYNALAVRLSEMNKRSHAQSVQSGKLGTQIEREELKLHRLMARFAQQDVEFEKAKEEYATALVLSIVLTHPSLSLTRIQ